MECFLAFRLKIRKGCSSVALCYVVLCNGIDGREGDHSVHHCRCSGALPLVVSISGVWISDF